jgi:glycerophosphoryl diester phosphodiesterase
MYVVLLVILSSLQLDVYSKTPLIIAHRGGAGLAPENTIAAFKNAITFNIDGLEMDVHLSSDGRVIVHHDYALKPELTRTETGQWLKGDSPLLKLLSYNQLYKYDIGRPKPHTAYIEKHPQIIPSDGEHIPLLEEVIHLVKNRKKIQLWIELKTSPIHEESCDHTMLADKVMDLIQKHKIAKQIVLLSFDWRGLIYVKSKAPTIQLAFLTDAPFSENSNISSFPSPWLANQDPKHFGNSIPKAISTNHGNIWDGEHIQLTQQNIDEAHSLGLKVMAWTVNEITEMKRLGEMGVDGITTDYPDRV